MSNHSLALDGEDVCVCFGADKERLAFVLNKVYDSLASVVIVLANTNSPNGLAEAKAFASELERWHSLNSEQLNCQFWAMTENEWDRLSRRESASFSVTYVSGDLSMPCPKIKDDHIDDLLKTCHDFDDFNDQPMVKSLLARVVREFSAKNMCDTRPPIALIRGASGTGKSFVARKIYAALCARGEIEGEFIHENCGLMGENDINATIFGVAKRAFTDTDARKGAVENAEGGILFLDEIGTLPLELQPRLLTLLDTGEYHRHGSGETDRCTCRFIFGTNANLEAGVRQGNFRTDLYFRIKTGCEIELPPVAERFKGKQSAVFIDRLLESMCQRYGDIQLTKQARRFFINFAKVFQWPGNFRQVEMLFQSLRTANMSFSDRRIVSARTMRDACELLQSTLPDLDTDECQLAISSLSTHELLKGCHEMAECDKRMLSFAFECAAKTKDRASAGRLFFEGKTIRNPSLEFKRRLEHFGFTWSNNTGGHIVRMM